MILMRLMGFDMILMRSMRLIFKYFFLERIDLTPQATNSMLPPKAKPRISSRESPNCFRTTRKRFFNQKEFSSDVGYPSKSFRNSIMYDGIIKDLIFSNSVCNSLEAWETKRRCIRTRYPATRRREKIE